jgi:odorant receptor
MALLDKIKSILHQKYYEKYKKHPSMEEMSSALFDYASFVFNFLGFDVFRNNFTWITKKFFVTILVVLVVAISYSYSIYHFQSDFEKVIFVMATINMEIQAIGIVYTAIVKKLNLLELKEFCKRFMKHTENDQMRKCFEKWFIIVFCVIVMFTIIAILVMIFIAFGPFIFSWILDEKVLLAGFVLPYSDKESLEGYTINYSFHVLCSLYCVIGFLAISIFISIFLCHYMAFYESLDELLNKLQKEICVEHSERNHDEMKRIFSKLIDCHNLCYEFLYLFESTFQLFHLLEVGGSMFGTAVSVFAITKVI